jgi:hypothetical protein
MFVYVWRFIGCFLHFTLLRLSYNFFALLCLYDSEAQTITGIFWNIKQDFALTQCSGCRADANEAAVILLPSNITVFTLDFSGSGLSGGDYVSLGWHEVYNQQCSSLILHSYFGWSHLSEIPNNLLLERGPQMCSVMSSGQQTSFHYRPLGAINGCCYMVIGSFG